MNDHISAPVPDMNIKKIPEDGALRDHIRLLAAETSNTLSSGEPPRLEALQNAARCIHEQLELPQDYLGFTMVALDNAFWAAEFHAVPYKRRLLLLPHCLTDMNTCAGEQTSSELICASCGGCVIAGLKQEAEALGYGVIISEGTSAVIGHVLEGDADAILGVACLDSLEKSFERIAELGIPHQSIPLLTDGCVNTTADIKALRETLVGLGETGHGSIRSFLPLLRETRNIFAPDRLCEVLEPCACELPGAEDTHSGLMATDRIARDWVFSGGKRLRPFITVAAYAVGRYGDTALLKDADLPTLVPSPVRSLAVAIEALHKASLVHDDIEDDDLVRYGEPTVHAIYGTEIAINVGDYLVGLGYRLIAAQVDVFGAQCIADILGHMSAAHLQLCCGQGTELLWNREHAEQLRPIDALRIGSLKTSPAFEVALFAGLRAAEVDVDQKLLREFATYVGEGFQVHNDLADWDEISPDKGVIGLDVLAERPTILRAFALEAGGGLQLAELSLRASAGEDTTQILTTARELYESLGVFLKAETLYARLRGRALDLADQLGSPPLQALMRFLVRNVLRRRRPVTA